MAKMQYENRDLRQIWKQIKTVTFHPKSGGDFYCHTCREVIHRTQVERHRRIHTKAILDQHYGTEKPKLKPKKFGEMVNINKNGRYFCRKCRNKVIHRIAPGTWKETTCPYCGATVNIFRERGASRYRF